MPKQIRSFINKHSRIYASVFMALVFASVLMLSPLVGADRFDEQINAIKAENSSANAVKTQLGAEAASLSDTINKLQSQIDTLRAEIAANQAKNDDLQRQIKAAEEELAKQKKLLGENIKAMYLEGKISTLEMLASSKDLSDFIDKEEYRNSVKDKIKSTLDKVTELKAQLKAQKETLEQLIKDQQAMQVQMDAQQAEQTRLLSLNQAQQAELEAQIKNNNSKITELRSQQAAENARLFAGSGSSVVLGAACDTAHGDTYPSPWCSAIQDSMIDSWGMYNRECVSYTAWKVAESGRTMPYWGGIGNANQWDDNAYAFGIPIDRNPRAGDVAVSNFGYYGHVMYVESVNPNGTINISQYNADYQGRFSRAYNVPVGSLLFIHFR